MSLLIKHLYQFGDFTVDTDQRVLLRGGRPLQMTPKVFDTLLILVQNSGRIAEKNELMSRLWPDTFVEDANLAFNIQQLRKSLGDNARNPAYIETIPRRGYRFIASVDEVLSDDVRIDSQIAQGFEGAGSRSPNVNSQLKMEVTAEWPESRVETGTPYGPDPIKPPFGVAPAAPTAPSSVWKRSSALAATLVVVLASVGFVLWRIENESSPARPLKVEKLTEAGQSRHVAISPDGKYIAYTRNFERKSGIWLRQFATNTNIEIVPVGERVGGLAFASSGEYLYFVRGDPFALYRVSKVGGVPTKIIDRMEGNFSVSSDDSQIAFIRQAMNREGQREYSLMIANSDGTSERTLLVGVHPDDLDVPLWSPDGTSILCAYGTSDGGGANARIVEVRVSDGMERALTSDRFFHIGKMAWLPHKSGLIVAARKGAQDNKELWRISYPGMELSQITEGLTPYLDLSIAANADKAAASQATRFSEIWVGAGNQPRNLKRITQALNSFCWTPGGRVVYTSTASGHGDLWIMQPDGTEQRQLTVSDTGNREPAVTPDNRYVVFISNGTGTNQVWRMNIDGTNQIRLTDGVGKSCPAISPDGRWVLYNTTDDWHLWKVSIDGGAPVRLTEYVALQPAVSPDGSMIACVSRDESKRELLILPFGGGPPLKRLAFVGWSSRIQWASNGNALIYVAAERNGAHIVEQSLNGDPPEEITDVDEDAPFDFSYSRDGQFLAVTRGGWRHDIVLISDLNRN